MIDINNNHIKEVKRALGPFQKKAPLIMARALKRAQTNVQKNISKETRARYHVKAKDVKETLSAERPTRYRIQATVISKGYRLPLAKFKVSPIKRPNRPRHIKVSVKKGNTAELLHAFIANINGNRVMERKEVTRLPIKQLMGPSVPEMVGNDESVKIISKEAIVTYNKRLNHGISRALEGH